MTEPLRGFAMSAPVPLRSDFDAALLRKLARGSRDPDQTPRLVALAEIYESGACARTRRGSAVSGCRLCTIGCFAATPRVRWSATRTVTPCCRRGSSTYSAPIGGEHGRASPIVRRWPRRRAVSRISVATDQKDRHRRYSICGWRARRVLSLFRYRRARRKTRPLLRAAVRSSEDAK